MIGTTISLLSAFLATVSAAEFARVCQSTSLIAPTTFQCSNGFEDYVNRNYPNGTIFQNDAHAGCQTIFVGEGCTVQLCSFPSTGITKDTFIAAAKDIINNCQTNVGGKFPNTGGYNIIKGTNTTVGVVSAQTPSSIKCTWHQSNGANINDCQAAAKSLRSQTLVTQDDPSGCKVVATSGECNISWCDAPGTKLSGPNIADAYVNSYIYCLEGQSPPSGQPLTLSSFTEYGSETRFSVYKNRAPAAVSSATPICKKYTDDIGPLRSGISFMVQDIQKQSSWKQDKKNTFCKTIPTRFNRLDICGNFNEVVATDKIVNALNTIDQQCAYTSGTKSLTGGSFRLAGTSMVAVLYPKAINKNIWCNPAPNNSPVESDCVGIFPKIDLAKTYARRGKAQGCTQLFSSGKCKLNLCSSQNTTISGRMLYDAFNNITSFCTSAQGSGLSQVYTSGIYQIFHDTSISVYDPPGYSISGMSDQQTPGAATGGTTACFKECRVGIKYNDADTIPGCGNNFVEAAFAGTCQSQPATLSPDRSVTVDLRGCQGDNDGLRMRWYIDPNTQVNTLALLDYGADANDDQYDAYSYTVSDCTEPETVPFGGAQQCVVTGGGCHLEKQ